MFTSPGFKKRHYAPFIVLLAFGVLSIALGVNLSLKDAHSATGSMYLQVPATAIKDKTVDVVVRINPGGAHVDTVTATIGFDPSKFAYSSVNFAGSPFTTQLPAEAKNDHVTVASSLLGGSTIDTDSLIAVVSFTPKVYDTKFQATFSLNGNAATAGLATDPAYADHSFTFTRPSTANTPTNPLEVIFPTDQSGDTNAMTGDDSPLAQVTPEDGTAVYSGAQILLKSSNLVAQARSITPGYLIMIGAGFILLCVTFALLAHYKKRHAELLSQQYHMNIVRTA